MHLEASRSRDGRGAVHICPKRPVLLTLQLSLAWGEGEAHQVLHHLLRGWSQGSGRAYPSKVDFQGRSSTLEQSPRRASAFLL